MESGSRVGSVGLRVSSELLATLTVSNSGASNNERLSRSFRADSVRLEREPSELENSSRVELTPVSSKLEELSNSANSIVSTSSSKRFSSGLASSSCWLSSSSIISGGSSSPSRVSGSGPISSVSERTSISSTSSASTDFSRRFFRSSSVFC